MSDEYDRPPADLVPRTGLTRETVARLCAMDGKTVRMEEPGKVVEDVDGIPTTVGPTEVTTAMLTGLTITRAEADELGIGDDDYAALNIVDPPDREARP